MQDAVVVHDLDLRLERPWQSPTMSYIAYRTHILHEKQYPQWP